MSTNKLNKRAILLTGTIIPNSIYTQHVNHVERLNEYIMAIKFYLGEFKNDDVFFLENSEYDLENDELIKSLCSNKRFSVLKFKKSDKYYEGKGYQEFEMIDAAVHKLQNEYQSFIKVTGRYIVKNAFKITNFNCKGLVVDLHKNSKIAQTYFIYFTTQFYINYLKGEFKKVNDNESVIIEKVIYQKIILSNCIDKCQLFNKTPILEGVSGSYKIVLKRNALKVLIRNIERFFYRILKIKFFNF
jgi:hypothetical protein